MIPGSEDPLEKEMATYSSIHACRIPWTEEPGRLQSMGWQRVEHDCMTNTQHSAAAAKSLQSCLTVRPHRRQPARLLCLWDSPSKNIGVGCHFLLQCMKVKSKNEVAHLYLTLCNSIDCSLPGSSAHGISQARILEWVAISFSRRSSGPRSQE